jgi:flagellar motility protein MotE (MotC chaperone)
MRLKRALIFSLSVSALFLVAGVFEGSVPVLVSAATETPNAAGSGAPDVGTPVAVDPRTGRADDDKATGCLSEPSVLADLQSQRERLVQRENDLASKESELKVREQAVAEQLKKLEEIRADIAKTQEFNKKDSEEKIAKVVDMIQNMSPKAAAKVINELDESLAVAAIDKMDTAKLSKIMNNLEPKKSSRLSEILAGVVRARDVAASQARPDGSARAPAATEANGTNTQ